MTPYVESGKRAQERLKRRKRPDGNWRESWFIGRLRGFKQVINTLSVTGLVLIPLIGFSTGSAFLAAGVALAYAALIGLLEFGERRVKVELRDFRRARESSETTS